MVKIALLGATGSIGSSTLEVVKEQAQKYSVQIASAHTDHRKLFRIALDFDIPVLVLTGITDRDKNAIRLSAPHQNVFFGETELLSVLRNEDYDIALNAISGSAGLRSSFAIVGRGKRLALANKESLVMAGHLLMPLIKEKGVELLPVDSEHSAIFQALGSRPAAEIRKLHITASGGAFRDLPLEDFARITPQQALKHPNWEMGAKVTLDSATMLNKALEVMEAHWLFGLPYDKIGAVLHPQSVIHSLVEFVDGSLLAQLSVPDMKLPILYTLSHPQRLSSNLVQTDLTALPPLTFCDIDPRRFPLYYLGLEVAREGGILPTVYNSANEAALQLFLAGTIGFADIHAICARAVAAQKNTPAPDVDTIVAVNRDVKQRILAGSFQS